MRTDGFRARRLEQLPAYLFVEIDRAKARAVQAGRDVIDFGVGDPDRPTLDFVVERMSAAIRDPANHSYSLGRGSPAFRRAAASYLKRRFGVELDPDAHVLALVGSKEGIGHLPIATVNPGETVLVPEPGYPVYASGAVFAGARVHVMPLTQEHGFLPRLEDIPVEARASATLMWLNYPNNPTAACADVPFYERAVAFARAHDVLVAQDAAYGELYFETPPPSILQVDGALETCIEFHSLSKTFNMTGWRVGFAAGCAEAITALASVKSNLDSGLVGAVQDAACTALEHFDHAQVRGMLDVYRRRRDVLAAGLEKLGWSVNRPAATFYMWVACPGELDSMATARRILDECDVVVIPGSGFGVHGEGFVRFALTQPEDRIHQTLQRLERLSW